MLAIRDAGEGRAVVFYSNSADQCSNGFEGRILTTPNGISVSVTVNVNGPLNEEGREHITITPLDAGFMAFPPEGLVLDGETQEFIIMGGMS